MKKNRCFRWEQEVPIVKKLFRIMKLTTFLLLISVFGVLANRSYSQTLSLNMENKTLKEVLLKIENASGCNFLYSEKFIDVERKVSVNVENEDLDDVLKSLFTDTDVKIERKNRVIILSSDTEISSLKQTIKLTGKVTDTTGAPLPGVTVVVKGTTNGTITDFDGVYSLSDIPSDAIIQFSFVGMKTQEIEVAGKTSISVTMEEDAIGIEEVVAIGYGTMKKSDLTGSVASVNGDILEARKSTQLSTALQGTMPGVTVTRDTSDPKEGATIRIRGITSIGESSPLVIVDGVPGLSINDINARDIESISVLKDAASASIYGARAAAGVILITTKRAKEGTIKISYDFNYGIEKRTVKPKFVGADRWMEIANEGAWSQAGYDDNEYPLYSKNLIDNYYNLNAQDPDQYPITDWFDLCLRDNAPKQSHALNLSFGSKNIKSNFSIVYDKTEGLVKSTNEKSYERISVRSNNQFTFNKFWSASADIYLRRAVSEDINNIGMESNKSIYEQLFFYGPIYSAEWSNGTLSGGLNGQNIYGMINNRGFDNYWQNQIGSRISVDFSPVKGFKLSAVYSANFTDYKRKLYKNVVPYYNLGSTSVSGYLRWCESTDLSEYRNDSYNTTAQLLANYNASFSDHNISAMAGYEEHYYFNESLKSASEQFELVGFPYLNLGNPNNLSSSGGVAENAYRSFFGRILYNYKSKYFLQANSRFDASSRFHSDHRWGYFPSISLGWVLTEEPFMQDKFPSLNFLKLRTSWGMLGNERIGSWNGDSFSPDYYPYQSVISFSSAILNVGSDVSSAQTAARRAFAIESISWESTTTYDVGIDAHFLNSKLSLNADYFKKITSDMLLEVEVPNFTGLSNPEQNAGKMETSGWELELGWNDNIGDLRYSVSVNLSDYKSVMGDMKGTEFLGEQIKKEGSEFNEWYGYKTDGFFQTQEEVESSAVISVKQSVGDVKYVDISGPDGVPDGIISPDYDRTLLGGSLPRYLFGGNIGLYYRNFDFSLSFQGVGKQNSRMDELMYTPIPLGKGNITEIYDGNYWSPYNNDEENLNAKYPRIGGYGNYEFADRLLFSGAYLRLKNITFGYTLPESINTEYFKSVRIYTSISDLFSIDNYPKGWDPEGSGSTYPITTSFIFGISLNF